MFDPLLETFLFSEVTEQRPGLMKPAHSTANRWNCTSRNSGTQHSAHHTVGGHGNDTDATEGRALGQAAAEQARDPSLPHERHHGGVLQVWKHGKRGRVQGGSHEMEGLVNSPRRLSRTGDREVPHPRNQQIKLESVSM